MMDFLKRFINQSKTMQTSERRKRKYNEGYARAQTFREYVRTAPEDLGQLASYSILMSSQNTEDGEWHSGFADGVYDILEEELNRHDDMLLRS